MSSFSGIHWKAPALIVLGLILGTAFALGHHYYYQHFNGQTVGKKWQQQWILRGGSAFGFAVKTFLAVASGTAYTQQFWLSMQERAAPIGNVDSMFTVLSSATQFLDIKLWLGRPVLAIPAIITWLVPLVAIITPGTLTVELTLQNKTVLMSVPQINFTNANNYVMAGYAGSYNSASHRVAQLVDATASQGSILPIVPPIANSSYTTTFFGPALDCVQASGTDTAKLSQASGMNDPGIQQVIYASWVPTSTSNLTSPNLNPSSSSNGLESDYALDIYSSDYARLFIYSYYCGATLTCGLRNKTYTVSFNFQNNTQRISVQTGKDMNGVSSTSLPGISPDQYTKETYDNNPIASYVALMESLGRIMVGNIQDESRYNYEQAPDLTSIKDTSLNDVRQGNDSKAFGTAIEQLFQNMTISLLSVSTFQDPIAVSTPVPVTAVLTINAYVYHPYDLYLAYGLSILFTSICLGIGMAALFRNGQSYSNNFSTVLRSTRNPDLDHLLLETEMSGADPLPEGLGRAVLSLPRRRGVGNGGFEVVSDGDLK
ncbi:hypothetical protein LPUS_05530 [Lasallia pustulata]|uniref:Uncharacterized protein n=1 Tax=Lasallia pustulata TaxID=136370 RepID=A0A1W5CZ22_9LECA|nr:hypothetical protein LPUS_05530 [Lasallia pustulata]